MEHRIKKDKVSIMTKNYNNVALFAKTCAESEMKRVIGAFPRLARKGEQTIDDLNAEISRLSGIIADASALLAECADDASDED